MPAARESVNREEAYARDLLAAAHRIAAHDGLAEGTWNHFSFMLDSNRMLITPADRHWALIDGDSLVLSTGETIPLSRAPKREIADRIFDQVLKLRLALHAAQ